LVDKEQVRQNLVSVHSDKVL